MVVVVDVPPEVLAELRVALKAPTVNQFRFQRVEEGLHVSVVRWCSSSAHTLKKAQRGYPVAKRRGRVLTSTVAVKDGSSFRPTTSVRSVEARAGEAGISNTSQTPGEDPPGALVHDCREIAPSTRHSKVRSISNPDLVGFGRLRLPQSVGMLSKKSMKTWVRAIDSNHSGPQARLPHEPFDSSSADAMASRLQRPVDSGAAICPAALLEERTNLLEQPPLLPSAFTLVSASPSVVPGPRDSIECTEASHRESLSLRFDELEALRLRAEQNRMALFGSSCSSCSRRTLAPTPAGA
jgi:hypothetical protein